MKLLGSISVGLATLGIISALVVVMNIPSAYTEFSSEPEDMYLLVLWLVVLLGVSYLWFESGLRLIRGEVLSRIKSLGLAVSFIALGALIVGLMNNVI